jgi:hypothetical protein
MPLKTAEINVTFAAYQTGPNAVSPQLFAPKLQKVLQFTVGVAANQADLVYAAERTITAAGNDDIDLAGVLADAFGSTITMAEVVALVIMSNSTNPAALVVGGGTNPWIAPWIATGDGVKVPIGGVFLLAGQDANGIGTVIAATGDILRVNNPGGSSATYQIGILARTA